MSQTKAQLISDLVQALNFTGTASAPANGLFLSASNQLKFATASIERLKIDGTEVVVNDTGASVDFRIEGDTDTNLFIVDASADKIGIGAAPITTGAKLEISRSLTDAFVDASDTILRLINTNTSANTNQTSLEFTTFTTGVGADSAIVSQAEDASGNCRLEFWTDTSNGMTEKMSIASNGTVTVVGNLDVGAGLDVTGTTTSGYLTLSAVNPNITFTDTNDNPDFKLEANSGQFKIIDSTNSADRLVVNTDGHIDIAGNVDFGAGIDVTGSVAVSGSTDGVLNLDTSDSRGAFVRFGQGGSFHNMVGCADGLITSLDKEDLGIRATDRIGFATNGDNLKMTILSSGNVGIGLIDPSTIFHIKTFNPDVYLENTGTGTGQLRVGHFTNGAFIGTYSDDAGASDTLRLGTHSGDTRMQILTGGQINIGDDLTQTSRTVSIHGGGNVGQLQVKGTEADIWMYSTGPNAVWRLLGSTGANTHRFRIYDSTNSKEPFFIDGSSGTNTSHVHINSGNLIFDQAGTGIDFSATGNSGGSMSSELLDDYEEGTWSPILTDDGTSGNSASSYTHQLGWYTKVGNLVNLQCRISGANTTGFNTPHSAFIKNLPFAIKGSSNRLVIGSLMLSNVNLDGDTMGIGILANVGAGSGSDNHFFRLFQTKDNAVWGDIEISQIPSGNHEIQVNFTYRAA